MISDKYKKIVAEKGKMQWLKRKSNVSNFVYFLKNEFKLLKDIRILDAGCAQGRDSAEIKKDYKNIIGIDYNSDFIKEAKNSYSNIEFFEGNIEKLDFKDEEFDAVYCVNTLFYTDPKKSLPELSRILKKGGILFVTLDKRIVDLDKKKDMHKLDVQEAVKILNDFKIIDKKYFERIDEVPFKHKHFFYEIVLKKN